MTTPKALREMIAAIIDPAAFDAEYGDDYTPTERSVYTARKPGALATADKILSLLPAGMDRNAPDSIAVGSIRLIRQKRGEFDYVVVEVERNGEWLEAIKEPHDNYFDHFISPSGIRALKSS